MKRGEYVEVRGVRYGSYDGEVGRVYGNLAPVKGRAAYAVDMGDMVITDLESDLTVVEKPVKGRRILK